jgi:mannose-6-phosphate isomerase-like protein (cupin superfamily)
MMARVFTQASAARLGLPGRTALEIVSANTGAKAVTLRLAEIPPQDSAAAARGPHYHRDCEECIFVLSGSGRTFADSGEYALNPGDTILIPAGENHVTRNTGTTPLLLLCFYPVADVISGTVEPDVRDSRTTS